MYDIARVAELRSMNSMNQSVFELGSRAANYPYRGVTEFPSC